MDKRPSALETSPTAAVPSASNSTRKAAANVLSSPETTILLVDSDPVMRAAFRDALQSPGLLVVEAGDLGAAVDRLNEVHPDLLIIRPYISSMTGRTAANYLRCKQHGLPVLILSGFVEDDRLENQSRVDHFFTFPKAYSRSELLDKVKEVLNQTKGQRMLRTA